MSNVVNKHLVRSGRSLRRRYQHLSMTMKGYERLGTRYGGWWVHPASLSQAPLLIDCGLGEDISFPTAFLKKFGGRLLGIEANPKSIAYCQDKTPAGMEIRHRACWIESGKQISFFVPENKANVSGSLVADHSYVGNEKIDTETINFQSALDSLEWDSCDVLKLDIERAEYEVLANLCDSGAIRSVKQLLVEYHHVCTGYSLEDTQASARKTCEAGFELVLVEDRNYVFRRTDNKN